MDLFINFKFLIDLFVSPLVALLWCHSIKSTKVSIKEEAVFVVAGIYE